VSNWTLDINLRSVVCIHGSDVLIRGGGVKERLRREFYGKGG
jgi:hypothetical protein